MSSKIFVYSPDSSYQFEMGNTIKFFVDGNLYEEHPNSLNLLGDAAYEDFLIYGDNLLKKGYFLENQVLSSIIRSWNYTICEDDEPAYYTYCVGSSVHRC